MKKYSILILVLAGIFITPQLTAQEDVKTQGTSKCSVKKSETKTSDPAAVPTVKSSKTKPGAATSDQANSTQTTSGTNTSSKTGTMTSSTAAAKGGKMYDAQGNLTYSLDQLGYIRNPKNRTMAQYTSNGEIIRKRMIVGKVENGVIKDKYGKEYARVTQEGKVYNADKKLLGAIATDGTVTNDKGTKIGSAPGVDKYVAAMMFFYSDLITKKN